MQCGLKKKKKYRNSIGTSNNYLLIILGPFLQIINVDRFTLMT